MPAKETTPSIVEITDYLLGGKKKWIEIKAPITQHSAEHRYREMQIRKWFEWKDSELQ